MEMAGFFVHESSYIDEDVEIGEGTKVWHFSHVMQGARIGRNCKLGQNVLVGPNVRIGNNVKIANNVSIYEGIALEDDVFCGPSCVFTHVRRPRSAYPAGHANYLTTLVKRGATVGANATILGAATIGECALVGAGAVVTKDVPAYALCLGNPARVRGWVCECGKSLAFTGGMAVCGQCHRRYSKVGDSVARVEQRIPSHQSQDATFG
jgi:UDP-2-acetamido-3-amino-2,3-dideoxy-glucuronate N-acetyltransferase